MAWVVCNGHELDDDELDDDFRDNRRRASAVAPGVGFFFVPFSTW